MYVDSLLTNQELKPEQYDTRHVRAGTERLAALVRLKLVR